MLNESVLSPERWSHMVRTSRPIPIRWWREHSPKRLPQGRIREHRRQLRDAINELESSFRPGLLNR